MNALRPILLLISLIVISTPTARATAFDDDFDDATLRVDFYQYGDGDTEGIAVDRLIRQGSWAGPVDTLIDPLPYGRYVARVTDPESGRTLVEIGFDSLYGEYRTTEPASQGIVRVFHESVLLPCPGRPLRLSFSRRDPGGEDVPLTEITIDPGAVSISEEAPRAGVTVVDAHIGGQPHSSLDIAIVGDGYTSDQIEEFRSDLARFSELLLSQAPYVDRRAHINIRGVFSPSVDEGCDQPTRGIWRSTAVGTSFNSLGSPRYLLTEANRDLRDIAANAPYDTLVIMVNQERYGGGGIYNRYCTFTAHGPFAGYLLLHEFGHSFGGLADEYYTSSTAYTEFYPEGVEPVQPNITAATDRADLKWADLVAPETPLPTPWDKSRFDADDLAYQQERREIDAAIAWAARTNAFPFVLEVLQQAAVDHALQRVAVIDAMMEASGLMNTIGAFEGAGYVSQGLYRPAIDCLMFSRGVKPLCRVCARAVDRRIDFYTAE
jgi:hypothetical protein